MATINEFSIWEPNLYELETTDPVIGGPTGISNLTRQQLANRTRKIFDILKLNQIFLTESEQYLGGQTIDVTASFSGAVTQGMLVYFNQGTQLYEPAQANTGDAREVFCGYADLSTSPVRMISGGLVDASISGAAQGDYVYLSDVTPGQTTLTGSNVIVGRVLYLRPGGPPACVFALNQGAGIGGGGGFDPEQDTYRMLLNDSFYRRGTWDNFANTDLVDGGNTDGIHNYPGQLFNLTSGEDLVSANLRDPLMSGNVANAFVSVNTSLTGTIWISANGGSNWESALNNSNYSFANPGQDLRIRFRAAGVTQVFSWGILYEI